MANNFALPPEVLEENARGFWDPLRWVLFAFPWGEVPEFSLVKLPEKWRKRYPNCEFGPDKWACEFLDEIGRQVRANRFDGVHSVKPLMFATASGHGIGKGGWVNSQVETTEGPKRYGDLEIGDELYGPDGKPTKIIGFPYEGIRPCYRVTFSDRTTAIVSREHLWKVRKLSRKLGDRASWQVLETWELVGKERKPEGNTYRRVFEIPSSPCVEWPERDLEIPPYIYGLWLGDGSRFVPVITTPDNESIEHIRSLGYEVGVWQHPDGGYFQVYVKGTSWRNSPLLQEYSVKRRIPAEYLRSSREQRYELLRGLMDSDGNVDKKGCAHYSTLSKGLAEDIIFLVRSLGGRAWIEYLDKNPHDGEPFYKVVLSLPDGERIAYVERKNSRLKPCERPSARKKLIDKIEYIGDLETRCVAVDREDGLYLTEDFVVTHNSFLTGLVCWWIMCTRPNCKGTITATTMPQLQSKTWAQIAALKKYCILGDLFDITSGKGSMKLSAKEAPNAWFCTGQTSKEENSESFAGQHAASSTSFYIFDEASGIPDKIWEVARGGLTDGEPMLFAFGNPTKSSGEFYNAFHRDKDQWTTFKVDSREAQLTNKEAIAQWEEQWGADSDFFKVRVRGEFPDNASVQFIPTNYVEEAMTSVTPGLHGNDLKRAIIGLDIARFGDDATVLVTRVGRDARSIAWKELRGMDGRGVGMAVEAHARMLLDQLHFKEVRIYFDRAGVGSAVWDYFRYELNDFAIRYYPVDFGMKAANSGAYANKRVEMWARMRDWLRDGAIPRDEQLKTELIAPEFYFNDRQQMVLERKADIKDRIGCSPDHADSLALTFADAGADRVGSDLDAGGFTARHRTRSDFDPIDIYEKEIDRAY